MSTTTPNLGLTVPVMGDGISSTIPALGTNFQTIDNQIGNLSNFKAVGSSLSDKANNEFTDRGINPKWYGASGSSQSTTGTMSAGSAALALASAIDFANNQGIAVYHAGAACPLSAPTGLTATATGTTGTTSYTYSIVALDYYGGVTAKTADVTVTNGNAALSATNYNNLSWTPSSGNVGGYAIYRNNQLIYVSYAWTGVGVNQVSSFKDTGYAALSGSYNGSISPIIPFAPPTSSLGQTLITTISSGAGTTSLTLAASATSAVSSVSVLHNDAAALQSAANAAAGKTLYIPAGTFMIGLIDQINIPNNTVVIGAGKDATIIKSDSARLTNQGGYGYVFTTDSIVNGATNSKNLIFRDLTIDGNTNWAWTPGPTQPLIGLGAALNCVVEKCSLKNGLGNGVFATSATNVIVKDCYFSNTGGNSISMNGVVNHVLLSGNDFNNNPNGETILFYSGDTTSVNDVRIVDNSFHDGVYAGIHFGDNNGKAYATNIVIANNNIVGLNQTSQYAVAVNSGSSGSKNISVTGNDIDLNGISTGRAMDINGSFITVQGNNIRNASTSDGVRCTGASYIDVSGNTFSNINNPMVDGSGTIGSVFQGNIVNGCGSLNIQGDTQVIGNSISSSGASSVGAVEFQPTVPYAKCIGNDISGAVAFGVRALNDQAVISDNTIRNSAQWAIYLNDTKGGSTNGYVVATGNNLKNNSVGIGIAGTVKWSGVIANNDVSGNTTNTSIPTAQTNGLKVTNNYGYNPAGSVTAPTIPASGTPQTNTFYFPVRVFVSGGTVTQIAIGGTNTGLTSGQFIVHPNETITITYSVAPTWVWIGE